MTKKSNIGSEGRQDKLNFGDKAIFDNTKRKLETSSMNTLEDKGEW